MSSFEGHTEVVDALLRGGADPNLAIKVWELSCSFIRVHCPIEISSQRELLSNMPLAVHNAYDVHTFCRLRLSCVRKLKPSIHTFSLLPVHVSSQKPPCSVPLAVAAQNGHTQTVERLLEGGANINRQDTVRSTCCTSSIHYWCFLTVHILSSTAYTVWPHSTLFCFC